MELYKGIGLKNNTSTGENRKCSKSRATRGKLGGNTLGMRSGAAFQRSGLKEGLC